MSISGGVLILFIIILRSLMINKLPKKTFLLLWGIVLLRLLLPFDLPLQHGIASPVTHVIVDGIHTLNGSNNVNIHSNLPNMPVDTTTSYLSNIEWGTVIWAVGLITLLLIFSVLYFREYQKMQTALPVSKAVGDMLRSTVDIPIRVKLLVSDRISTPLTFGILTPKIILPKILKHVDILELKYVLTHELIHIKRADNLWKVIMLITVCIHWFNPLVWIMYILFNRDIELSCDEKVLTLYGENTKKEYAMALVNLAEKQYHWSLFSNGFGKNAIQERIVAIMKFRKITIASVGCAILLLGAAATVFAQNDNEKSNRDYLYSDSEGMNANANSVRAIAESKWFPEYEKYGLSYDSSDIHLLYDGNIVGYFKDEVSAGTYTRILDNAGTVGIVVARDSNYQIVGLNTTDIPDYGSSNENTGITDNSSFTTLENNDTDYEEGDGDSSKVLNDYVLYGITYNSALIEWDYGNKQIAGLIDNDNIYIDENANNNSVFLQIENKSVKEISEKQFNKLCNNLN